MTHLRHSLNGSHPLIRILVAVAVLFGFAGSASAAAPIDVADLFPPGTLAYAELHNPSKTASRSSRAARPRRRRSKN
jgi:hypothetical protein